jgi:hypothetical protein
MGVEPTGDRLVPPDGFEVREAHRDSSAPNNTTSITNYNK